MKKFMLAIILLAVGGIIVYGVSNREEAKEQPESREQVERYEPTETREELEKTEAFIQRWLQNDNGTIATYILDGEETDEDLVKGRETLAETVGLFLLYALEKNDQSLFDSYYDQFEQYFLNSDGFVDWKLNEEGESEVSTNALIDDIRIMEALVRAEEKWGGAHYVETAEIVGDYLDTYNVNNGIYVNFYETEEHYASEQVKLSYIDVQAMNISADQGLLDEKTVANTVQVLKEAPLKNGFYPISYNVETGDYMYDEQVNIVDQAILAYHFSQVGERSEEFLAFIQNEMDTRGLIHGMYDLDTKEPAVNYESPAIYGYLISYALYAGEEELAQTIYDRMKEYQVMDTESEYYGGYAITNEDTHIFDNLVPLIAEQAMLNR